MAPPSGKSGASTVRLAFFSVTPAISHSQGMVESLEDDIRSFFEASPNSVYIAGHLSSYERLLAHACCAYNRLSSRSETHRLRQDSLYYY